MDTNNRPVITERIMLNDIFLVGGNEGTGRVIFKNLSGENFDTERPAFFQTHGQYLAQIQHLLGCQFAEGDVISLRIEGSEQPEVVHTFTAEQVANVSLCEGAAQAPGQSPNFAGDKVCAR